jgi:hypothetical protein
LDNITINYTQNTEEGEKIIDMALDLNKISPLPPEEEGNWYEWQVRNWGTKWNVTGWNWERRTDEELLMGFDTAWGPCIEAINKLARLFPKTKIKIKYCEPGEGFAGKVVWKNGKVLKTYETKNNKDKIFKELGCKNEDDENGEDNENLVSSN